jgi:hypothetical protein
MIVSHWCTRRPGVEHAFMDGQEIYSLVDGEPVYAER